MARNCDVTGHVYFRIKLFKKDGIYTRKFLG